jgi:starch-binding outer membrane protein, SusD/RagB family
MKIIFRIRTITTCVVFIAGSFLFSCTEKFLELYPTELTALSDYYKTEADAQTALTGAYSALQLDATQSGDYWQWGLEGFETYDVNTGIPTQRNMNFWGYGNTWSGLYTIVTRANTVIERVEKMNLDQDSKAKIIAQARFLRGLAYFNLGRWFGNVPIVTVEQTSESNFLLDQGTQTQAFEQAKTDFEAAASSGALPVRWSGKDIGRVTKGGALGFLAKVKLFMKDNNGVISTTQEINALVPKYQLLKDYDLVWDTDNSEESLFEVQYRGSSSNDDWWEAQGLGVRTAPSGIGGEWAPGGGWGSTSPSKQLYDSFEPTDQRRKKSILAKGDTLRHKGSATYLVWNGAGSPTELSIRKHWRHGTLFTGFNESYQNLVILRYSEVLLNYAEALNEVGQADSAIAQVNKIRSRADLNKLAIPTALSKAQIEDAIFKERRTELCGEFSWWSDLVRTGRIKNFITSEYGLNWENHWNLHPIPPGEINLNTKIKQNPGYQ